jgi:hypothetical protein
VGGEFRINRVNQCDWHGMPVIGINARVRDLASRCDGERHCAVYVAVDIIRLVLLGLQRSSRVNYEQTIASSARLHMSTRSARRGVECPG